MLRGSIERIKAVKLRFKLRALGQRKTKASQNLDRLILYLRKRMKIAVMQRCSGERKVESLYRGCISLFLQQAVLGFKGLGDHGPGAV